ncbi:hypothetical protein SAMCCGM7_pC0807 (plasmid) [Sinorhizobium americanum CCGM7]|nr:hypothetical protein SAMCCGM7_pC0807 [Sinorhizobium americanum CCGM7]
MKQIALAMAGLSHHTAIQFALATNLRQGARVATINRGPW